jgi:hypothetical protein
MFSEPNSCKRRILSFSVAFVATAIFPSLCPACLVRIEVTYQGDYEQATQRVLQTLDDMRFRENKNLPLNLRESRRLFVSTEDPVGYGIQVPVKHSPTLRLVFGVGWLNTCRKEGVDLFNRFVTKLQDQFGPANVKPDSVVIGPN